MINPKGLQESLEYMWMMDYVVVMNTFKLQSTN